MRKIFELHGLVSLDGIDIVNKHLKKLDNNLKTMSKNMVKTGKSMQKIGAGLNKYVTIPLGLAGVAVTKFGADFQKSMTTSLSIMGDVSDDMKKKMGDTAKAVSEEMTPSASELAKAYYFLASAGMDAAQSLSALPVVTRFATAGQFNLSLATDLLTDAQSALGLSVKNVAKNEENMIRVSDVLTGAMSMANATTQQFSEALTNRAATALSILKKDIEEGVAILTVFADKGIKGAEAGTKLDIALRDIQKSAINNKSAFEKYNVAVYDSEENMRNTADIVEDLENALDGMSDKQKKATMMTMGFQEKSVQALMTLIGTSEQMRENEKRLRSLGGITEKVAKNQIKNFWDQLTILKNKLVNVVITLSETLLPVLQNDILPILEKVVAKLKGLVNIFSNLSPEVKRNTLKFFAFAALIGPMVFSLGTLLVIIGKVRGAVMLLNSAFLMNPIGLITVAIGALYLVFINIAKYIGLVNKNFSLLKTTIKAAMTLFALFNGATLESIKTAEKLNDALKKGGKEGAAVLLDRLRDVNSALWEQQRLIKTLTEKMNAVKEVANKDFYQVQINKATEKLKDLETQAVKLKKALEPFGPKAYKKPEPKDDEGTGDVAKRTGSGFTDEEEDEYKKLKAESDARIKMWDEELKIIQQKKVLYKEAETALFKKQDDESNGYKLQWEKDLKALQQKKVDDKLKAIEIEKQQQKALYATIIDSVMQLGNIVNGFFDNKAQKIDNDYNKQKQAIENSKRSETQKNKLISELDAETAKKKKELARKSAMAEKATAIFSIGINTARGVMNAFATLPPPAAIAMAAIIGVLGAVQAGIVAAKPIPAAKGIYAPAQSGGVITQVGEGRENEVVFPLQTGVKAMVEELIKQSSPVASTNMSTQQQNASPGNTYHMHVGTLIADDQGLMELERRMSRMSVTEAQRMGAE